MALATITFSDVVTCLEQAGLLLNQKGAIPRREMVHSTTDTRKLQNGDLFIAYKGVQFDAHSRVPALALQFPATVFIIEEPKCFDVMSADHVVLLVKDSREAWSHIAALRYGNPQEQLKLLGVTGTNGKTSTVWFFREILGTLAIPCMTLGTLGVYCGDEMLPASHTTPDPEELFKSLALAKARGIEWIAMEISSHAIVQKRLGPLKFDAVAFTSFSRDHLDFHPTMKEYFAAKWELFTDYCKPSVKRFVSTTVRKHLPPSAKLVPFSYYGPKSEMEAAKAEGYAYQISESRLNHSFLNLTSKDLSLAISFDFGGDFALDNFTAAFALVNSLLPMQSLDGSKIKPVPGRFEPVPAAVPFNFAVIVDYAHTPDALEKTLTKLKEMTTGQLWVVFGCGGDRDPGKRPLMGAIAEKFADQIIVSSDNPRTEMPGEIINQILKGMPRKKKVHVIEDRLSAIEFACLKAKAGDSILIAGKGHENYQIIGNTKFPFDDRLVSAEVLQKRSP